MSLLIILSPKKTSLLRTVSLQLPVFMHIGGGGGQDKKHIFQQRVIHHWSSIISHSNSSEWTFNGEQVIWPKLASNNGSSSVEAMWSSGASHWRMLHLCPKVIQRRHCGSRVVGHGLHGLSMVHIHKVYKWILIYKTFQNRVRIPETKHSCCVGTRKTTPCPHSRAQSAAESQTIKRCSWPVQLQRSDSDVRVCLLDAMQHRWSIKQSNH